MRGAKGKYDAETYPKLAEGYARQGLSDKQIAHNLGVCQDTFYKYMKKYPEFAESIKRGKQPVDFEVENQLLKRALGYTVTERQIEYYSPLSPDETPRVKTIKEIKRHIPADITASIFWLMNRMPDRWKDKKRLEVSGKIEESVKSQVEGLTPEERTHLKKKLLKKLALSLDAESNNV